MLVLVVEDDDDIRAVVLECLRGDGFEAFGVSGGREALEVLDAVRPDVILLDLVMGDMDGWKFREQQLMMPSISRIPVVVMTGLPSASLDDLNAAAVVPKPFTAQALAATLRRSVGAQHGPRAPSGSSAMGAEGDASGENGSP